MTDPHRCTGAVKQGTVPGTLCVYLRYPTMAHLTYVADGPRVVEIELPCEAARGLASAILRRLDSVPEERHERTGITPAEPFPGGDGRPPH